MLICIIFFGDFLPIGVHSYSQTIGTPKENTLSKSLSEVPVGYTGIYTVEDLDMIRNHLDGKFILMNDIDLTEATSEGGRYFNDGVGWKSIGTTAAPFSGILDGNGHMIIGMKIWITSNENIYAGLFGAIKNGQIKNVGMSDTHIQITNQSSAATKTKTYAGAIAGFADSKTEISNSFNTGNVTVSSLFDSYAGGLVGYAIESSIQNCYNTGNISAKTAGGIAGTMAYFTSNISNSTNSGNVKAEKYAGGITAFFSSGDIYNCNNTGDIDGNEISAGIASQISSATITSSQNYGVISSYFLSGGIAGEIDYSTIDQSMNNGSISSISPLSISGGIAGESNNSKIINSININEVNSKNYAGGIAGKLFLSTVKNCSNSGNIKSIDTFAGGIAARNYDSSKIINCYNIAAISGNILGGITGSNDSTIENTYNIGSINKNSSSAIWGAITGENTGILVSNYYLDMNISGVGKGKDNGTSRKTLAEMSQQENFEGFDFQSLWTMGKELSYRFPTLINIPFTHVEKAENIYLKTEPSKTIYVEGENFDVSGAIITAETIFKNQQDIEVTPEMVKGYNKYIIGPQIVMICYEGMTTSLSVIVVEADKKPPARPIVEEVTDQSTIIKGVSEAGSTIKAVANGMEIGTATAGADCTFNMSIPLQKASTELMVIASDQAGNVSDASYLIVKDITAPALPTLNEITNYETVLTGTAEPDAIVIAMVSGVKIGQITADKNGKFFIPVSAQQAGTTIGVYAVDGAGNVGDKQEITVSNKLQTLIGSTRYSTAVEIAKKGWTTSETVLIGNGDAIVDGLTATPLASSRNAPLLLTMKDYVPVETIEEVKRLKAKNIILIGGTSVISDMVEGTFREQGYTVSRIGGKDRYETSLLIAKELDKIIDVNTIYMAYGRGEPDALSIAAQAGQVQQPIILTDKTHIPLEIYNWLQSEGLLNAYFIGGTSVLSEEIINQIDRITSESVDHNRISGLDRHETNARVISKFYQATELQTIMIAKSETEKLVDALTAGPLAAKMGVPVLLVSQIGISPAQKECLSSMRLKYVNQIGGGINPLVVSEIMQNLK